MITNLYFVVSISVIKQVVILVFTVFMMLLFADAHAFVAYRLHGVNAAVGLCTTHDLVM